MSSCNISNSEFFYTTQMSYFLLQSIVAKSLIKKLEITLNQLQITMVDPLFCYSVVNVAIFWLGVGGLSYQKGLGDYILFLEVSFCFFRKKFKDSRKRVCIFFLIKTCWNLEL